MTMITDALVTTIAILGVMATLAAVILVAILHRGPKLIISVRSHWPRQHQPAYRPVLAKGLESVKCLSCSGGTQWLSSDGAGWGPIPEPLRYRVRAPDGDFDCRPPLHTGMRSCLDCAGWGSIYRDVSYATTQEEG